MKPVDCKLIEELILQRTYDKMVDMGYLDDNDPVRPPQLVVVTVGEDTASQVYVNRKKKIANSMAIKFTQVELSADVKQSELEKKLTELSKDKEVDGIILQLPIPEHLNQFNAIDKIDPKKDVDGLTTTNKGLLATKPYHAPCTPSGIMEVFMHKFKHDLSGLNVAIINRSPLVGLPLAQLLTNADATVTVMHSKTKDISMLLRHYDAVVLAMGTAGEFDCMKLLNTKVQLVVDVTITRDADGKLIGDLNAPKLNDFEKFCTHHIEHTPVPGGVGLLTVASLMENTINSWKQNVLNRK